MGYKSIQRYVVIIVTLCYVTHFSDFTCAGTLVIEDSGFANGDWSVRGEGTVDHAGPQSLSGTQVPIGGTPGSYRELRHEGNQFGFAPPNPLVGWHFYEAESYSPSAGAIVSLTLTEDVLLSQGPSQSGRVALRQDGILFRSKASYAVSVANAWESIELMSLTATDFEAFFNGSFIPTANPDFSEGGGKIIFGVYRGTAVPRNARGVYDYRTGVDNWKIALTTEAVPEPLTISLLAIGSALLASCRKRSR